MNKVIYICRAKSGNGKSTFAESLVELGFPHKNVVVCCADDYMVDESGGYQFKPEKLGFVHKKCFEKFTDAVKREEQFIVVANTNANWSQEAKKYYDFGIDNGYIVFSMVLEKRHEGKNIHGVNEEILKRQEERILNSIKL